MTFVKGGMALLICLAILHHFQNKDRVIPYNVPSFAVLEAQKHEMEEKAKQRARKSLESDTIYYAKKAVATILKDPDSAKFKDVFFNETKEGGPVACGRVNSKNSFGAYTGFQRFISSGKTTFMENTKQGFVDIWVGVCLPPHSKGS